jgi:hypothetical protein
MFGDVNVTKAGPPAVKPITTVFNSASEAPGSV